MRIKKSTLRRLIKEETFHVLYEAHKGTWRQKSRELSRASFRLFKEIFEDLGGNDSDGGNFNQGINAPTPRSPTKGTRPIDPSGHVGRAFGFKNQPDHWKTWKNFSTSGPKSLRGLGIDKLIVQLIPDVGPGGDLMKKPIQTSGGYFPKGGTKTVKTPVDTSWRVKVFDGGRVMSRMPPRSPIVIEINVHYDISKFKFPYQLKEIFPDIYAGMQSTTTHELWHHRQFLRPKHPMADRLKPSRLDILRRRMNKLYDSGELDDAYWVGGDRKKDIGQGKNILGIRKKLSRPAAYLASNMETDAHVRGYYKRAKKSKGKLTFEQLIDLRLDDYEGIGGITPKEKILIRKVWMDYARRQLPCATLSGGGFIYPKGCMTYAQRKKLKPANDDLKNPKIKAQAEEEVKALKKALKTAPKKPGTLKKILRKLPILGRLFILTGIVVAADEAYAREGVKGLAKVSAETAVDLTPIVGDVKGIFDLVVLTLKSGVLDPSTRPGWKPGDPNLIGHGMPW